ncbi:MAG: S8 family peptidase [Clostridiales bacterium]|nr:S8 family peptidase [Clostridiales bacterium]
MDLSDENRIACREAVMSEDYGDFLVTVNGTEEQIKEEFGAECVQILSRKYAVITIPIVQRENIIKYGFIYSAIPKLYGLMDTSNIENIGVQRVRNAAYLDLFGRNVLIGFIDTGIDYTNSVFKNADNTSRIYRIWDQTIQTGEPPTGLYYGTEYTKEQIDRALTTDNPLEVVPTTDENGHGTFMAGIAAGNIDEANDFTGIAPQSEIMMVKLKPSKTIFREYYFVNPNAVSYQETDILLGVRYLVERAREAGRPLILCLGVGTNSGGHDGNSILDEYLSEASDGYQACIIVPTGNEANYGGHYRNTLREDETFKDIEIRVGENEVGFSLELWANAPSVYTVGFISPSGEYIQRIPPRTDGNQTVSFLFEPTTIYVGYRVVELRTGDELILMRFNRPTPGIWKVRVFMEQNFNNPFDLWLPIQEFLSSDTQFIQPDPDITITSPGNTEAIITVAAYNHMNNAIFINSGRGFTRSGRIKPDITAPGVNIYGPLPGNQFSVRSGTSIAAAHAAGAAALLMEWGVVQQNNTFFDTSDVKALMIKGARRSEGTYPNREYGYGTLDVFGAFESLRTTL